MIYHLSNFDVPTQSGFRVIQKIVFAGLCKPYHIAIIIQLLYFHFEWKKIEEETLQKIGYLMNKTSFLGEIKTIFHILSRAFFW